MELILVLCLMVALVIAWTYVRDRLNELDQRINALASAVHAIPREAREAVVRKAAVEPKPEPVRTAPPVAVPVMTAPPPVVEAPPIVEAPPVAKPPVATPVAPQPVIVQRPVPAPAFTAFPEEPRSSEDWETLLGGNWLNKLGVFVLVIGIALLLGYSFKHLGPWGIDSICIAIGLSMLGAGVALEPKERYQTFARGLLGGGWAALYFTVYAMQAIPAARVIFNPWAGAVLLLAVACGMIVHSLRYRSQVVTGMAYFIAFVTLAITDVTTLSVIALVPLAASLLYIARRAQWGKMALFGLIATYATCATRPDLGAPLWQVQTIFAIYWLLFEGFDLLNGDSWLLPLNALGFLSLSLVKWERVAPHQIWQPLAATAAAYLVSAVLRARSGRWHAAITLSSALAAVAIFLKLEHQWLAFALFLEAELLYLAGERLRQSYLRMLAAGLFAAQVTHLAAFEVPGLAVRAWSPLAALECLVFYANRALRRGDLLYGYAAAGMAALVAGSEAPEPYRAIAWLALGLTTFGFGWRYRLADFRMQGYLLGALGLCGAAVLPDRLTFTIAAALSYGLALCAVKSGEDRMDAQECEGVLIGAPVAAVGAMSALLWKLLPHQYLGLGWLAMSLPVLELGRRGWPRQFIRLSYGLLALGVAEVLGVNVLPAVPTSPLAARLIPAGAAALCYLMMWRTHQEEEGYVPALASIAATIFAYDAIWLLTPTASVAPVLAIFALALLVATLRPHAYAIAGLAFANCWFVNFERGLDPVFAGAAVIALLYTAQLLTARESRARWYFSLLATSLWAVLLYYQVEGNGLTVAWGIEGVVLLGAGFPLRDRVLRLSGLALLLSCILKLFVWDLRHLETLPRIFSFLALGAFLVGVSWIYTRFRSRVEQYL
jgi:uncharacterized membrane protein